MIQAITGLRTFWYMGSKARIVPPFKNGREGPWKLRRKRFPAFHPRFPRQWAPTSWVCHEGHSSRVRILCQALPGGEFSHPDSRIVSTLTRSASPRRPRRPERWTGAAVNNAENPYPKVGSRAFWIANRCCQDGEKRGSTSPS